jgi:hypothetical protein
MSFKVVTTVTYYDEEMSKRTWTDSEKLEPTVPESLVERAGRPVSYAEYKQVVAQQAIAPFVGDKDFYVALTSKDGNEYFTILRGDIVSAKVEIIKTLDAV